MHASAEAPEFLYPLLALAALVVIVSRLIRVARQGAPTTFDTPTRATPPARRPLWGPGRKLEKLNQNTALVRAEVELAHSTIDQLQARHNLNRLMVELAPPPPARQLAQAAVAALTLAEIRAVLASVDMPRELRATLLELLEATANEKARQ